MDPCTQTYKTQKNNSIDSQDVMIAYKTYKNVVPEIFRQTDL